MSGPGASQATVARNRQTSPSNPPSTSMGGYPTPIGLQHGSMPTTRVPDIFKEAASWAGAVPPVAPRQPPKVLTSPPLDEDDLKFIIVGVVSGIPQVQRYIADNYTLPDVEFVFLTASVRGRDNLYYMYRAATTMLEYKLNIRDIILTPTKACIMVDLKVKPRGVPFIHNRTFPCCVIMHFATDPADGRTKVSLQHDHHSAFMFFWMGGLWGVQLVTGLLNPLGGLWMVTFGKVSEWLRLHGKQLWAHIEKPVTAMASDAGEPPKLKNGAVAPVPLPAEPASQRMGPTDEHSAQLLDAYIRQATQEISLSMVDQEDVSAYEAWGPMGWVLRTVGGCIGLCVGYTLLVLSFATNFFKPVP